MLAHELVAAMTADRDRTFRDRQRHRRASTGRSLASRLRARFVPFLRPRPALPPTRSSPRLASGLGVVRGASGRASGTHGQGAC